MNKANGATALNPNAKFSNVLVSDKGVINDVASMPDRPSYENLQDTINTIDSLSQDGFSEISTLAGLALKFMETPDAYLCPETISRIFRTIRLKADDIENVINCEAENVGCNYKDKSRERRYQARRAAETKQK